MRKFFLSFLILLIVSVSISAKDISPLILTIKSYPISDEEKAYIKQVNPYGFIFVEKDFKRGIDFLALKQDLVELLDHPIYFFMDQEGGKVNRLKYLFPKNNFPSAEYYGDMANKISLQEAKEHVFNKAKEMALYLSLICIDVNLAPNAEIRPANYNGFFKTRLYSHDPKTVKELSESFAEGTLAGGVEPCYKHFPGTALSETDPHTSTPVINNIGLQDLIKREFVPFQPAKNYKYIMMGHALYPLIDEVNISTFSPKFYKMIRERLHFKGLIITDALNMKATGNISIGEKISRSLSAGADLAMPFFDENMPFDKRLEELKKIPDPIIKRFNKKLQKM